MKSLSKWYRKKISFTNSNRNFKDRNDKRNYFKMFKKISKEKIHHNFQGLTSYLIKFPARLFLISSIRAKTKTGMLAIKRTIKYKMKQFLEFLLKWGQKKMKISFCLKTVDDLL